MPKRCAIWLDHRNAWIVTFTPEGDAQVEKLESGITALRKATGGTRSATPYVHGYAARNTDDEKRLHQLSRFYEAIVARVRDFSRVLVMGPGQARQELGKALDDLPGQARPRITVHPAEKMTQRQLVARARKELDMPTPL
ncbi:hypothetical protein JXA88_08910 [Candidatus Fermentibacteria bacterium]|nr:hypothetical protein [Candidatus Fermentibacteria bacterium]